MSVRLSLPGATAIAPAWRQPWTRIHWTLKHKLRALNHAISCPAENSWRKIKNSEVFTPFNSHSTSSLKLNHLVAILDAYFGLVAPVCSSEELLICAFPGRLNFLWVWTKSYSLLLWHLAWCLVPASEQITHSERGSQWRNEWMKRQCSCSKNAHMVLQVEPWRASPWFQLCSAWPGTSKTGLFPIWCAFASSATILASPWGLGRWGEVLRYTWSLSHLITSHSYSPLWPICVNGPYLPPWSHLPRPLLVLALNQIGLQALSTPSSHLLPPSVPPSWPGAPEQQWPNGHQQPCSIPYQSICQGHFLSDCYHHGPPQTPAPPAAWISGLRRPTLSYVVKLDL